MGQTRSCGPVAVVLILATSGIGRPVSGELIARAVEQPTTVAVGPGATGARVIRAQILLGSARFSPGEIDGRYGDDLAIAIKGYQENHGLKPTGIVNTEMWQLLDAQAGPLLITYTITAADVKGPFEPIPSKAEDQAKLRWMGWESPQEELGEKFHMSPKLLAELNPGAKFDTAGEQITVVNVRLAPARRASRVVVSKSKRTVTALGTGDKVLAQYPATIGDSHDPLPIGDWKILSVIRDPWFNWDPVHYWNVDPERATERLAPGPNNPVGTVWMGLSKAHYGIHGTPDPGHIRHEESYGCIRLTNWDANDLSHMVVPGTPAILEE
jgi:lipoprotein-anchoring transpeptidase ErfK/SrfK